MPDERVDGVKLLSELSGLSKQQVTDAWQEAKANVAKLRGCQRHLFLVPRPLRPGERPMCANCAGRMALSEISHYIAGYVSGRNAMREPNQQFDEKLLQDEIWPGWAIRNG